MRVTSLHVLWVVVVVLAVAMASCSRSIGMRQPPASNAEAPRAFCDVGVLIKPGEFMGRVGLKNNRGDMFVFPLLATDSLCLLRRPAPWVSEPIIPDSLKPSRFPTLTRDRARWS